MTFGIVEKSGFICGLVFPILLLEGRNPITRKARRQTGKQCGRDLDHEDPIDRVEKIDEMIGMPDEVP